MATRLPNALNGIYSSNVRHSIDSSRRSDWPRASQGGRPGSLACVLLWRSRFPIDSKLRPSRCFHFGGRVSSRHRAQHVGKSRRLSSTARQHGLYHLAILYPTRAELADALLRLVRASISLDGASDHGVSEALYLRDPDNNGVELYWDRPPEKWPRTADGAVEMFTRSLDLDSLLAEAKSQSGN